MRATILILLVLASPAAAQPDPPGLTPDPPPLVRRVESLEITAARQAVEIFELKAKVARLEGKKPYTYSASVPVPVETFPGVRGAPPKFVGASSGHTHTCANGHEPYTWGEAGHGHNCPICGVEVAVQDSSFRSVTGASSYGALSGGCADGSCEAGGASSSGLWFPGKKLIGRRRGK